jgi:two-component system cell cycle sensor histidine kinase/response regulator CckA
MDDVAIGERSLPALRARVLGTAVAISAVAMPLLSCVMVIELATRDRLTLRTFVPCAITVCFPALWLLSGRLSLRGVSRAFLALLLLMAFVVQSHGGITVTAAALELVVIVLSGLLFGPRGAAAGLLASLACFSIAGGLVVGEYVPPIDFELWDPLESEVWIRSGLSLLLFGATAVLAVVYIVQQLERETLLLRATLGREQRERVRREQAESERALASQALVEAHRLEALGRLAGGVAHDFNNVLTVILSATHHALGAGAVSPSLRESLDDINRAAGRAASLTRELLVLGRKDLAAPRVVDVPQLLARLRSTLRRLLPSDIELDIARRSSGRVRLDPAQLERVLLNLVANARDAIAGAGQIEIASVNQSFHDGQHGLAPGHYVCLSVKDDGSGIDDATRQRLFEPFFTTKPGGKGSGLGLAMVRAFVLEAGGQVVVSSSNGSGTVITLCLPADDEVAPDEAVHEPEGPLSAPRAGRSILVVEDDRNVRAAIVASLTRAGYLVHEAGDGHTAYELLSDAKLSLDLLCVDGVIPGIGAQQLIEQARARVPALGVVVCSGYVDEELLRRGIQTGKIACVRKPFTPQELLDCIGAQFRQRG